MWVKVKTLLLLLSLAVNVPFLAMWSANMADPSAAARRQLRACQTTSTDVPSGATTSRSVIPRGFSSGRTEPSRSVYREVGVTEEQWHEIEPRLAQFRAAMFRLGRDIKRQRNELVDLIAAPDLDIEAVRAKQDEILDVHRRMGELVADNLLADRETLTTDQQAEFFKKLRVHCGSYKGASN
jgi:Spy/CpxP family protein refolding chaperone